MNTTEKMPLTLKMSLNVDKVIYHLLKNEFELNGYKKEEIAQQIKSAFESTARIVNYDYDIKVHVLSQIDLKRDADNNSYTNQPNGE